MFLEHYSVGLQARHGRPGNWHQHQHRGLPPQGEDGGNISVTLGARILPPSPRSGSSSLGGGTPPIL
eukprot:5259144-Pyramimonas_sp.AAC.1